MHPADRGADDLDEYLAGRADGQLQHMAAEDAVLLIGEGRVQVNIGIPVHRCDVSGKACDFTEAVACFTGVFPGVQIENAEDGMLGGADRADPGKADAFRPAELAELCQQIFAFIDPNREIRKMCEHFDLEVIRLRRIAIGNVKMGKLKKGMWRDLTEAEIRALFE